MQDLVTIAMKLFIGYPAGEAWLFAIGATLWIRHRRWAVAALVAAVALTLTRLVSTAAWTSGAAWMMLVSTAVALVMFAVTRERTWRVAAPVLALFVMAHLYARVDTEIAFVCSWQPVAEQPTGVDLDCASPATLRGSIYSEELRQRLEQDPQAAKDVRLRAIYLWGTLSDLELHAVGNGGLNQPPTYVHWDLEGSGLKQHFLFF